MKSNTEDKIIAYIKNMGQVTDNDLTEHLEISRQAVHRQISRLQEDGLIYKIGRPPKVLLDWSRDEYCSRVRTKESASGVVYQHSK